MMEHDAWPALVYEDWAPTKKTLHHVRSDARQGEGRALAAAA